MQINRLFEMVYLLLDKKSMTAQELADHFEVSKRTILRDIDVLSAAKIPICTTQGKGGGVSLMEGYVLNKTALTEDEQNQILLALQSLSATKHAEASDAIGKLSALFQKSNVDWIAVDFSRWGQNSTDNVKFNLLKDAILGSSAIQFEYVSASGETTLRTVYPLKLVFKSKSWYLQGFCIAKQDYRTFKLTRMLSISKTDARFDADQYLAPPIEDAQTPIDSLVELEVAFPAHVAYRVYDEFDEGSVHRADDGTLHVFTHMPEDQWLYSFLMSFGKDIRVLQPQHVKENLMKLLNKT